MLCGKFNENNEKKTLYIRDVDGNAFRKVMDMWYGKLDNVELALDDIPALASVADRFQISEVTSALDETTLLHLSMHTCSDVLNWSGEHGLRLSEQAARKLATERFNELVLTESFLRIDEEAFGKLLEDNYLGTHEEAVWEAVTVWRGAEGQARGRGLVKKIRFPLMEEEYLRSRVVAMAPAQDAEWMEGVVAEALLAKAARGDGGGFEFKLLGLKALDHRVGQGVRWRDYVNGGERHLKGHTDDVRAVAVCGGRVCSGSMDGWIRVWSATGEATDSDEPKGMRLPEGDAVLSLSAWEGRLISGNSSGKLWVWNVVTGTCDQVLDGHARAVVALAVCGSRLASGSEDQSVKVWGVGEGGRRACERTLRGHTGQVLSLAGWRGSVVSGSWDKSIRVWDAGTGALDATLAGHDGAVVGLAVHRDRLYSASYDGTIRAWALGTWSALRTVEAYGRGTGAHPCCLAVSGSRLVSGSWGPGFGTAASALTPSGSATGRDVRVWGLERLDLRQTIRLQPAANIWALAAGGGRVWAGVGRDVVWWGRGV
jgi:hypothetical protein